MSTVVKIPIQDCLLPKYVAACIAAGLAISDSKVLAEPLTCEVTFTDDLDSSQEDEAQDLLDDCKGKIEFP